MDLFVLGQSQTAELKILPPFSDVTILKPTYRLFPSSGKRGSWMCSRSLLMLQKPRCRVSRCKVIFADWPGEDHMFLISLRVEQGWGIVTCVEVTVTHHIFSLDD